MALSVFERAALHDFPDELTIEEAALWMTASGDDRNGEAKFRDACSFLFELVKRGYLPTVRSEEREWGRHSLVSTFNGSNLLGGSGSTFTPIVRNNETSRATSKMVTTVLYVTPQQLRQIKEVAERASFWGPCVKDLVGDTGTGEQSISNMSCPKKKPKAAQARNQSYKDYLNAILPNVMEAVRDAHRESGKPVAINDPPFTIAQITRLLFSLGLLDGADNDESVRQVVGPVLEVLGYIFKARGGRPEGADKDREGYEDWLHAQVRNRLCADEITKLKVLRA